ncbi:unnamed protein product [Amaranthus hypochondriacus]
MASKTKTTSPSYTDFEPACELKDEEGQQILIIHLPDFKKEQLRVQVNKEGTLKVSGERTTTLDGNNKRRFVKETKVPNGCAINSIKARFSNGCLQVIMPKELTPQVTQQQPIPRSQSPRKSEITDQNPRKSEITDQNPRKSEITDQNPRAEPPEITKMEARIGYDHPKGNQMQGKKKIVLGFGIGVVTMLGIGAFVAYKYGYTQS